MRILEIGDELLFKRAVPEQTDFFWTGYKPRGHIKSALGLFAFVRVWRRLRRNQYDLLAIHVPLYPPWHPRVILTVLRDWRLHVPTGLFAVFAWWLIQRGHRVPIVALDLNDSFAIGRHAHRLIDTARGYFKRELPADKWQAFFKSGHANLPGLRWRLKTKNIRRVAKLRPLSYGSVQLPIRDLELPKRVDIFFAGSMTGNSTARAEGVAELTALGDEGYIIDIPAERLDVAEFHRRIAQAYIAWSPGGLGWDCGRHYEIAWLGTAPLMNYPTIVRDQPFLDGLHCVLYGPEPGALAKAARRALADKERLAEIGRAAAEHVRQHHTAFARAERVALSALGRRLDGQIEPQAPETGVCVAPAQRNSNVLPGRSAGR